MFESIVSKIVNLVVSTLRALGAVTRNTPWLAPAAILALVLVL